MPLKVGFFKGRASNAQQRRRETLSSKGEKNNLTIGMQPIEWSVSNLPGGGRYRRGRLARTVVSAESWALAARRFKVWNPSLVGISTEGNMVTFSSAAKGSRPGFQAVVLAANGRLDSSYIPRRQVSCEYRQGVLLLRGRLRTYYAKQVAQEAVRGSRRCRADRQRDRGRRIVAGCKCRKGGGRHAGS